MIRVTEARHVSGYIVRLRFSDGTEGALDLAAELHGPIFEPLRDPVRFAELRVDPELATIVWPNGADFAPEFLHEQVKRAVA
jgi:hypothetical protein